jgi:phasin family protein
MGKLARIGADAARQVMKQQQDMFLTVMGRWRDAAGDAPREPAAMLGLPLEAARFGTEVALQNATELAEIARQTQADVLAVLTARAEAVTAEAAHAVEEGVKETSKLAKKAVARTAEATGATAEQIALAGKMVE